MRKLLALYLPKAALNFVYLILGIFALNITIKFLPVDSSMQNFLSLITTAITMFIYYFSDDTYLPGSLNWILLTPIRKKSVLAANIFLNLFKSTLLLLALLLLTYSLYREGFTNFFKELSKLNDGPEPFNSLLFFSSATLAALFILLTFGLFYAGTTPSNYTPTLFLKNPFFFIKRYFGFILLAGYILCCFSESEVVTYFFPPLIKFPMAIFIGFYIVTNSTLKSLRIYYSINSVRLIIFFIYIAFVAVFYCFIARDLKHQHTSINFKIEVFNLLGPLASDKREILLNSLKVDTPKIERIQKENLDSFFAHLRKKTFFYDLQIDWEKKCSDRLDYYCRLSSYLLDYDKKKEKFDFLNKGCTNDVESCKVLTSTRDVPKIMVEDAMKKLDSSCVKGHKNFETRSCKDYLRNK